jgi:tyrosyl-tRNA synthetase
LAGRGVANVQTRLNPAEQLAELTDGIDRIESGPELLERLKAGRPLRVKLGLDPTSPDLHLGHAVVLHKLQQFVEFGHDVTLVIGDFTASIGDPSGRNALRPQLDAAAIRANMETYAKQAGKVLDLERVRIRYNSEWLGPLGFAEIVRLAAQTTVAQLLERNDFAIRYGEGTPISLHEFLYPIAQAYDSVALEADVELGGSDQLFNLLFGRHYQHAARAQPQICITVPLLEGLDGANKMSKSLGNHIGLSDAPADQFGKAMRMPDELMPKYARLALFESEAAAEAIDARMRAGANPMEEKKRIAFAIVERYHGRAAAEAARDRFERTVQRREMPEDMPEISISGARKVADVIVAAGFAASKREAERLIAGGAVRIDGSPVDDAKAAWPRQAGVLSVGARKFVRVAYSDG